MKTRTSKTEPRTVPVLTGDDFSTYSLADYFASTFCSLANAQRIAEGENKTFGVSRSGVSNIRKYTDWRAQAIQALILECKRTDKHVQNNSFTRGIGERFATYNNIKKFNNRSERHDATLARVWNRAMTRLGYNV